MTQSFDSFVEQSIDNKNQEKKTDIDILLGSVTSKGTGFINNIYDLAMGANKSHYLGEYNGQNISFRLTTCYENAVLCSTVPIKLVELRFPNCTEEQKNAFIVWYSQLIKIIISATPKPLENTSMSVHKQFSILHADSPIKFSDLEMLHPTSLGNLITQIEQLETRCNPTLEKLSDRDIEELLSQLKKQQIRPSDLNWNLLYQLLGHVIQTTSQKDNTSLPT